MAHTLKHLPKFPLTILIDGYQVNSPASLSAFIKCEYSDGSKDGKPEKVTIPFTQLKSFFVEKNNKPFRHFWSNANEEAKIELLLSFFRDLKPLISRQAARNLVEDKETSLLDVASFLRRIGNKSNATQLA